MNTQHSTHDAHARDRPPTNSTQDDDDADADSALGSDA